MARRRRKAELEEGPPRHGTVPVNNPDSGDFISPETSGDFPVKDWSWAPPPQDTKEIRSHLTHYRWPPSEDGYEPDVPERYGVENLVSDTDAYPAVQETQRVSSPYIPPVENDRKVRTPSNYRFFRPFGHWRDRHGTGEHASLATLTKDYEQGGMHPWYARRNTHRVEPPPRDVSIMDVSSNDMETPAGIYTSPELTSKPSPKAWRL